MNRKVIVCLSVAAAVLAAVSLWPNPAVEAQEAPATPCWDVVHGPIGPFTRIQPNLTSNPIARDASPATYVGDDGGPEEWESVLINRCTGDTWYRVRFSANWAPIGVLTPPEP